MTVPGNTLGAKYELLHTGSVECGRKSKRNAGCSIYLIMMYVLLSGKQSYIIIKVLKVSLSGIALAKDLSKFSRHIGALLSV